MRKDEQAALRFKFFPYRKKKILVYGTGKVAEQIIDSLYGFNIVGVIDRSRSYGRFKNVPILMWEELEQDIGNVLIIASAKKNYEEIFRRIQDKCIVAKITILGSAGENLSIYFGNEIDRMGILKYCEKNIDDLKRKIEHYDAISFDIFDTIIMRKTLEPWDVFDIVEQRVNEKGIRISDFKKKRMEAEQRANDGTIHQVYNVLQEMLNINSVQRHVIFEQEIQCERELLIPRYETIEAMRYAFGLGKTVSLISDTCISTELLKDILYEMGVKEFNKIYVSCDYKTGKEDKLFEIYIKDMSRKKCLHIGDDRYADIKKPKLYGIDTYEVKSALELLRMSEMHTVLGYVSNINEKNLIGLLISEIFNSPFSLNNTFGVLKLQKLKTLGKVFFAPLVIKYISELLDYLNMHGNYDMVLFAARDGYLFHNLYEKYRKFANRANNLPQSVYFLTSRKLALRASLQNNSVFRILKNYLDVNSAEELLKNIAGLKELHDKKEDEGSLEYINKHEKEIINKSRDTQKNYQLYMENLGINKNGKYLFCEMDSQGTTQYALGYMFDIPLDGFYLSRYYTKNIYNLPIKAIYVAEKFASAINQITSQGCFLETILTSPNPSVADMAENGIPVFEHEERSFEEIDMIQEIQIGIKDFFEEYIKMFYMPGKKIADEIAEITFRMFQKTIYEGDCLKLENINMHDNLLGISYDIWNDGKRISNKGK